MTRIQEQITLSAYERKTIHNMFLRAINWLEKYVEIVYSDNYPDWQNRKQIHNDWIKRTDIIGNPKLTEETFATKLLLFERVWESDLPFFEELKEEFYNWINATGINVNNCPERLKHFLFGFHEILEGRGEKIERDAENKKRKLDPNSPEYARELNNIFASVQGPLQDEREAEQSMAGKNWNEIDIDDKIKGNAERGEKAFNQIAWTVSNSHNNFYFFPQKTSSVGGTPPGSLPTDKVDKITTEIDNFNRIKKQEIMLVRQGARLNDFDPQTGKLNLNNNPIYKWNSFKVQQKFEIKNTLSENKIYLDKDYLTDDEISFVIKEFADNPSVWRIESIQGQEYLIHNSAQGNYNNRQIGTLIHSKEKFSKAEWTEINEALELNKQYGIVLRKLKGEISPEYLETRETLEIWAKELEKKLLINGIRKNADEWEIRKEIVVLDSNEGEVLVRKTAKINIEEDYDLTGGLKNRSNELYNLDYFNEKELAEINSIFAVSTSINQQLVDYIKRGMKLEKGLFVINQESGKCSENEDWYIDNQLKRNFDSKTGYLIFVPNLMIRAEDLNEAEQKEIGYKSEQTSHSSSSSITPKNDDNIGKGGIIAIIGISALLIGGVVVVKKRLNKKVKK